MTPDGVVFLFSLSMYVSAGIHTGGWGSTCGEGKLPAGGRGGTVGRVSKQTWP